MRRRPRPRGRGRSVELLRRVRDVGARPPELRVEVLLHELPERLARGARRAAALAADPALDDLEVAQPPHRHALVELDQQLADLVEVLKLAAALVELDDREPGGAAVLVPRLGE